MYYVNLVPRYGQWTLMITDDAIFQYGTFDLHVEIVRGCLIGAKMTASLARAFAILAASILFSVVQVSAFAPRSPTLLINVNKVPTLLNKVNVGPLSMAPRYDKSTKRWSPSKEEEEAKSGYGPLGSLIRQGPVPFVRRLADPDAYDQAVLKMMGTEGMARDEAQGNFDAFLQNPNDWALQKLEEKRTGVKYDYANANMDVFSLVLTASWTGVLLSVLARVLYVYQNGCDDFCKTYHW